jgi:inosine-uridine nucleoside N-ribohydrolase
MNRRGFLLRTAAGFGGMALSSMASAAARSGRFEPRRAGKAIPVIFDTDIGDDIDDTWALAFLLASPELETKLVVTDSNDTVAKARIAAKFLEIAGRTEIPVGIGKSFDGPAGAQAPWAEDYDLESYPGRIHEDGVGALIRSIMESEEEIALLTVGPVPNIREALRREPRIAEKARVVAMSGSIDLGYGGSATPSAEYNVRADPAAARDMYGADWDVLLTPLDTAGLVRISGERYQRVLASENPATRAIVEGYRVWNETFHGGGRFNPDESSSTLFDAVAVYLAFQPNAFRIEEVTLEVTADGHTRRAGGGAPVRAAMEWRDMEAFKDLLVGRLTE